MGLRFWFCSGTMLDTSLQFHKLERLPCPVHFLHYRNMYKRKLMSSVVDTYIRQSENSGERQHLHSLSHDQHIDPIADRASSTVHVIMKPRRFSRLFETTSMSSRKYIKTATETVTVTKKVGKRDRRGSLFESGCPGGNL